VDEQVAAGGYLRTMGGTGISGKYLSLWDCTGSCVQVTEDGMNSIGPTDSNGYAGKYWTPSSSYEGIKNYILFFAGDSAYNQSQTPGYALNVIPPQADIDCYNESIRRGFSAGDCYGRGDFIEYHPCLESYSAYDPIGSYGSCSPNSIYNCEACHNCPTSPPSDSVTVGIATVNITGTGRNASTPSSVPGFHRFDEGSNWRSYHMDENRDPLDRCGDRSCGGIFWCWSGLDVKHSWTTSGDQITVTTEMSEKNTNDSLGVGFNFNGSYKFTSVSANASSPELLLQTDTDSQQGSCLTGTKFYGINSGAVAGAWISWTLDMEYCGDGECNCGETCSSCQTDCTCDLNPPVVTIEGVGKAATPNAYLNSDFQVKIRFREPNGGDSGLDVCNYQITNFGNPTPTLNWTSASPCNSSLDSGDIYKTITVGASGQCRVETSDGCTVCAEAYDKSSPTRKYTKVCKTFPIDFTPPTTEIK